MKKKTLQKLKAKSFWMLFLVFLIGLSPGLLKAQPIEYRSEESNNILIGTSDSRLMASIYETDTSVTMKLRAIGYMKVDMIAFAFFYDPSILRLCNPDYTEVTTFGPLPTNPAILDADLTAKNWLCFGTHKDVGTSFISRNVSGHESMRAILLDLGCPNVTENLLFSVEEGKVKSVFEVHFKKVTTNKALENVNIGIGVKTSPIAYQPKFGYDGLFLWYKDVFSSSDYRIINQELFLYRSGSSVTTDAASDVLTTTAQLNGTFLQGNLPASITILDTTGTALSGKGKLNRDTVRQYGFIYSLDNVNLSISEFSDSIKIGTTYYAVPTDAEILAGIFTRGQYDFNIIIVNDNEGVNETSYYSTSLSGLTPNQQYYAWAYMHYTFETSDIFQAVGNKITFTTSDCIALNIGTVFTVEEPYCGDNNGKIQMYVTGGSGSYLYKVNDEDFASYPGGLITGLEAGTYTITVRDSIQVTCETATVNNIVLHNANTDLSVSMTSDNAETCDSQDGTLYVAVTGGKAPYNYFLDGTDITGTFTHGMITGKPVGIYVMNVTDAGGCSASSGEVRINSDASLSLYLAVTQHTTCGSSVGEISFSVAGTSEFTYQLDGYPEESITNYNGETIVMDGLSAGVHYLRVTDICGEKVEEFTITNGTDAFAFEAIPSKEILSCNNVLIPGSITLNVTDGDPTFQYRIDGGEWISFPEGANTVIISDLHNGFYRIEVKDTTNKCTYEVNKVTIEREIHTPIQVGTYYTAVEPDCGDLTGGAIFMHVTGGSGSYLYKVNDEGFASYPGGLITGLAAGTYTIIVKDAVETNCGEVTISNIVLHNATTDLAVTMTSDNAKTCSSTDGILYVNVTGGVAPYTYWLDGVNITNSPSFNNGMITGKGVGTYVLEVKDNTLCVASSGEVRIYSDDSKLEVEVTVTQEAICGSNTGAIKFTVTNANSPYTYQIDGYTEENGTNNVEVVVNGLSAGVHYLRITDNCGELIEKFTITNGTGGLAFEATPAKEVLTCTGTLQPGSITLVVSNGTPNFKYRVDSGTWKNFAAGENTVTINDLHTGVYVVEVKDTTGCTYEVNKVTIEREIYTQISVGTYFVANEPTCKGKDGAIQIYVTGGSGSYLYKVNDEEFASYPGGLISGLAAGTYTITVKDSVQTNSCSDVTINNIVLHNSNTDLFVSMTSENAETCATPDGKLFVTVTGGKEPYKYYLDGVLTNVTNGVITGKTAGVYVLNVVDADSCVASSGEVRIYADDSMIDVFITVTEEAICGSNTGAIKFNVENSASYKYSIDGSPEKTGTGTTEVIVNGLSAGTHYLRITDDCGEKVKEFEILNGTTNGLTFTATPVKETLSCEGDLLPGSISLEVTNGTPNYKYRVDGGTWINFADGSNTVDILNLHSGSYFVEVKDTTGCTYKVNDITILRETSHGTIISSPVATSPQTFCSTAKVSNLQATGVNIKWYLTPTGGVPIDPSAFLISDTVYYAAQSIGTCESGVRTAVKVIINDEVILDIPIIASPQELCGTSQTLTIADIATDGNTNIVWYDYATGGTKLNLSDPLYEKSYFATIEAGTCQSAPRVEVVITFTNNTPDPVVIASPQYFCEGAMIGNIVVPNTQILWYTSDINGTLLPADYLLQHNTTYYATQKAGECESVVRTAVLIYLTAPEVPELPEIQGICGKSTLADITVTGAGIVWYDAAVNGNVLPLSTKLEIGKSYWAAQSSMGNCEGARTKVTITDSCYVIYGTMFPFVYNETDLYFNDLFPVNVKLYAVPPKNGSNPIEVILNSDALYSTRATYYDGSVYIPNTPKYPGAIGATDNPGIKIDWTDIGKTSGTPNDTPVTGIGDVPVTPVGMYKFENVIPGEYILEIYRQGFIIRWAKITINEDGMSLGHRELIAGDVNDDFVVDMSDLSNTNTKLSTYPSPLYNPKYDLNGDGNIDNEDIQIIINNYNAYIGTYEETLNWASSY
jgi:hypothetical protein